MLLSLNRYERKKNVALALRALREVIDRHSLSSGACARARLVIAGGHDPRVRENLQHAKELAALASDLDLQERVVFLKNISEPQRCDFSPSFLQWLQGCMPFVHAPEIPPSSAGMANCALGMLIFCSRGVLAPLSHLLRCLPPCSVPAACRKALLAACHGVIYTPELEHFGIVPLEAMARGRPVIALASGGPLETVLHRETGFLSEGVPMDVANAVVLLLTMSAESAAAMAAAARMHVAERFSCAMLRAGWRSVLAAVCGGAANGAEAAAEGGDATARRKQE